MSELKNITLHRVTRLGIDDLERGLPEGPSGSFAASFEPTPIELKQWEINAMQNALDKPNRDRRNAEYIARLKESGDYGKEHHWDENFGLVTCDWMDEPKFNKPTFSNHQMFFPTKE